MVGRLGSLKVAHQVGHLSQGKAGIADVAIAFKFLGKCAQTFLRLFVTTQPLVGLNQVPLRVGIEFDARLFVRLVAFLEQRCRQIHALLQ